MPPAGFREPVPDERSPDSDPFSITVLLAWTPTLWRHTRTLLRPDGRRGAVWRGDAFALRSAIRLAQVWGAEVRAVSLGLFVSSHDYLEAADLGVDTVRWIVGDPKAAHYDRAVALAAACEGSGVVFAGSRGPGHGSGAVPVYVAGVLHAACATEVVSVAPGPPGVLLVERDLDDGRRESAEIVTPCVLACVPPPE